MKFQVISRVFFLVLVVFCVQNSSISAANLHAFIVCDTYAEGIEPSIFADQKRIVNEVKHIAKLTGLKTRLKLFNGYNANSQIIKKISGTSIGSDDVVLFYWSGHGMRFHSQEDPGPVFYFSFDSTIVSLYEVTAILMSKSPRLIVSIADCCNEYVDAPLSLIPKRVGSIQKVNYKKLFLESSGTYIASAASPGEVSLALNQGIREWGLPAGGFYTTALLSALQSETKIVNPALTWEIIFDAAYDNTIEYQMRDPSDATIYHHPFFEYIPHS